MPTNNPNGRPKTAYDGKARTHSIRVRFSPAEHDAVVPAADAEGVTLSEFAREATLTRAGVRSAKKEG